MKLIPYIKEKSRSPFIWMVIAAVVAIAAAIFFSVVYSNKNDRAIVLAAEKEMLKVQLDSLKEIRFRESVQHEEKICQLEIDTQLLLDAARLNVKYISYEKQIFVQHHPDSVVRIFNSAKY